MPPLFSGPRQELQPEHPCRFHTGSKSATARGPSCRPPVWVVRLNILLQAQTPISLQVRKMFTGIFPMFEDWLRQPARVQTGLSHPAILQ